METSKRRQIPSTNASKFQLQVPSQKKFVTLFRDYFRHAYKLHTRQRQPSTRTGEFTMAAAGRAFGPTRAAPGIMEAQISALAGRIFVILVSFDRVSLRVLFSVQTSDRSAP